ncbi:hypothetical protein Tco_1314328 [Tanacetum coccineum]
MPLPPTSKLKPPRYNKLSTYIKKSDLASWRNLSLIGPLSDLRSGLNSFISSSWLVGGLFASLAFLGALTGQHIGYILLTMYVSRAFSKRMENLSPIVQANWAKLEAERSLYKSGFLQWLILLAAGNYFKVGSLYIALVWLVSPAFAYGLLVATLSSARAPKALKTITLLLGLFVPFLISGGMFIRLAGTVIGIAVRFDRYSKAYTFYRLKSSG